jgi:hypothetical protein
MLINLKYFKNQQRSLIQAKCLIIVYDDKIFFDIKKAKT